MQKQARVYMDRAQKCGSRKLWLSVTALNAVSLVAIHSTLIPNQRPLAKDSKISLPFRYLAHCSGGGREGQGPAGVGMSWAGAAARSSAGPARLVANCCRWKCLAQHVWEQQMRSLGLQAVISSPCVFRAHPSRIAILPPSDTVLTNAEFVLQR